jgi:hypothetical protein
MRFVAALVCGLALAGVACSSSAPGAPIPDANLATLTDGGIFSCTIVQPFPDGATATLCLEVPANGGQGLQQGCSRDAMGGVADGGTVTFNDDGGCSRDDSLGACRAVVNGQIQDQWYYGAGGDSGISVFGQDASTIKTLCGEMSEAYLAR